MGSRRSISRPLVIGLALVLAACAAGGCTQYATPTERLPRGDDAVGDWRGSPRDPALGPPQVGPRTED